MDLWSLHVFGELCVCLGGLHVVGGCVFGGVCIYWGFVYIRGIGRCWGTLCVSEGSACAEASVCVLGMCVWQAVWVWEGSACIVDCMCFGDLCMWVFGGDACVWGGLPARGISQPPHLYVGGKGFLPDPLSPAPFLGLPGALTLSWAPQG